MPTLKELRDKQFLSVPELAKLAEIPASTIYNIEAGENKPVRSTIRRLAKGLGVKPEEIVFGEEKPVPRPGKKFQQKRPARIFPPHP